MARTFTALEEAALSEIIPPETRDRIAELMAASAGMTVKEAWLQHVRSAAEIGVVQAERGEGIPGHLVSVGGYNKIAAVAELRLAAGMTSAEAMRKHKAEPQMSEVDEGGEPDTTACRSEEA